jgi:hypothetical protein
VLYSLGRWGVDFMVTADGSDAFRSGWFTFATENFLADTDPAAPEVTIGLNATDAAPVHIVVGHGAVELRNGPAPDPGLTLAGEPRLIMGVLSGKLPVHRARAAGLSVAGDPAVLARAVPACPHSAVPTHYGQSFGRANTAAQSARSGVAQALSRLASTAASLISACLVAVINVRLPCSARSRRCWRAAARSGSASSAR